MLGWGRVILETPSMRRCAFCKYWYDPTCEAIRPARGQWEYKMGVKKPCRLKHNVETKSSLFCPKFECKL